jgi:DNA-binding LacI/PurR family transcriptional regulator
MPSIRDVAKQAGVSISTVSRVVSGSANVEKSTRDRVLKVIEDTGYRPNLNARSLRSRSGQLVGLALPKIVHDTFSTIIHHAEKEANRMGYGLIIGNTNDDPERERAFIQDLLARHVDAIIFSRVSDASHLPDRVRERGLPIVVIDRGIEHDTIPSIETDNYGAGKMVANMFLQGGHRRIATVTGPQNVKLVRDRDRGFLETLEKGGVTVAPEYHVESNFEYDGGVLAGKQLLELDTLPTAIWAQSDMIAVGLLKVFQAAGVRVPDDVSLVGMDNVPVSKMVTPALTSVDQSFEEFCRRAFYIIHAQLEDPTYQPPETLVQIPSSIVIRESFRNLT